MITALALIMLLATVIAAYAGREYRRRLLRRLEDSPTKLRLLADWFDAEQRTRQWRGTDVQQDLRTWADAIEKLQGLDHDATCSRCLLVSGLCQDRDRSD